MPFMTKVLRVVTEGEQVGGATVAQPVRLVGADGEDVELGGDAPTTIPTGALVPGAGIDLARDAESGVITASVKAKGVTAAMLADGAVPAAYVLPAATTAALGGVKRAAAVATVASADAASAAADAPTKAEYDKLVAVANETKRQLNALLAAGKAAGFLS